MASKRQSHCRWSWLNAKLGFDLDLLDRREQLEVLKQEKKKRYFQKTNLLELEYVRKKDEVNEIESNWQ